MGVDAEALRKRLSASNAASRCLAADQTTDWITGYRSGYDDADASVVMRCLALARLREDDPAAGEAQLHALSDLAAWHDLPADVLQVLRSLDPQEMHRTEREYLTDLLR